jgi:excisionase family DNA binding protein
MGAMDHSDVRLLKPAEVADMLGVSRSWLYAAAQAGRIPYVRLGGADGPVRFRRDELEDWIARGSARESVVWERGVESTRRDARAGRKVRRPGRDAAQLQLMPAPES